MSMKVNSRVCARAGTGPKSFRLRINRLGTDYVHVVGQKDRAQKEFEVYQKLSGAEHLAEIDKERAEVQQFVYGREGPAIRTALMGRRNCSQVFLRIEETHGSSRFSQDHRRRLLRRNGRLGPARLCRRIGPCSNMGRMVLPINRNWRFQPTGSDAAHARRLSTTRVLLASPCPIPISASRGTASTKSPTSLSPSSPPLFRACCRDAAGQRVFVDLKA